MIICSCHFVSESEIKIAIESGSDSLEKIGESTGAGTCCGICRECIENVIDSTNQF